MEPIPQTMRALVAPKYCRPAGYTVTEVPLPQIRAPEEVLVRVHYGTISFGEVSQASGAARLIMPTT